VIAAASVDAHALASMHRLDESAPPNRRRRFGQKRRFGERRSDTRPETIKIFLLPKSTTQSPHNPLSAGIDKSP